MVRWEGHREKVVDAGWWSLLVLVALGGVEEVAVIDAGTTEDVSNS